MLETANKQVAEKIRRRREQKSLGQEIGDSLRTDTSIPGRESDDSEILHYKVPPAAVSNCFVSPSAYDSAVLFFLFLKLGSALYFSNNSTTSV